MEHLMSEAGFPQEANFMQCGIRTGQMCLTHWVPSASIGVTPSNAVCLTGGWHPDFNEEASLWCRAMKHIISTVQNREMRKRVKNNVF